MRVIHWNIKHNSNKEKVITSLIKYMEGGDTILCLQEVTPVAKDTIVSMLGDYGVKQFRNYAYSLDYRHPSQFDGLNRRLGVLVICPEPMWVLNCDVISRSPFPDRTIYADIVRNGEIIRVMSLHSITGCAYHKAKSSQYFSFAEAVDELRPDIVTIDANEPKIDHYNVEEMVFYNNSDNGNGAKTFFNTMVLNGMSDAFVHFYNPQRYESGKYLATSIIVNRKGKCRYDFMYMRDERFYVRGCNYLYEEGIKATSDHAIVMSDVEVMHDRSVTQSRDRRDPENRHGAYPWLDENNLVKLCRFYGHPKKQGSHGFADYERHWVEDVLNGKGNPLDYVKIDDLNFLSTFFPGDGVPLGIKAILFNRYFHWSSYSSIDNFKEWYLKYYIGTSYEYCDHQDNQS